MGIDFENAKKEIIQKYKTYRRFHNKKDFSDEEVLKNRKVIVLLKITEFLYSIQNVRLVNVAFIHGPSLYFVLTIKREEFLIRISDHFSSKIYDENIYDEKLSFENIKERILLFLQKFDF